MTILNRDPLVQYVATGSASTSITVTLDTHASGNVIFLIIGQDGGGTPIAPNAAAVTAGWTEFGTQTASGGTRMSAFYLVCDSPSETNPTFTGANDEWIVHQYVLDDVHASVVGSWQRKDWNNAYITASNNPTAGTNSTTPITPSAGSLLIVAACSDGTNPIRFRTNDVVGKALTFNADTLATATFTMISGYRQVDDSAAVPSFDLLSGVNTEGGNIFVWEILNVANGRRERDCRTGINEFAYFGSWDATLAGTATPWTGVDDITSTPLASINSITCSTTNPTVATLANSITPWGVLSSLKSAESTAGSWVGGAYTLPSSIDMSGQIFSMQWQSGSSSSTARYGTEGVIVVFSDGTNWTAYRLREKAKTVANQVEVAFIVLGGGTPYASEAGVGVDGSIDWTAVTRFAFAEHRVGSVTTDSFIYCRNPVLLPATSVTAYGNGIPELTGGGTGRETNFTTLYDALSGFGHYKLCEKLASSLIMPKCSFRIGDGTTTTKFDSSAVPFEFPPAYNVITQPDWNGAANKIGMDIKTSADDVINVTAGAAIATQQQGFTVNSASVTPTSQSFAGESIVGMLVTDSEGFNWTSTTFKNCGTVTIAGGGDMTNCSVTLTSSTNAAVAITADGTVLTGCTIDGTGAAYALELGTSVTAITLASCTLTAGSLTPFDKVHVLKASGTVTITISGTTTLSAGEVTSAGATVVIAAPQPTLDATVLANSRVVLYNNTTAAELDNTAPGGTSWSKVITSGASNGDSLTLHVFKEGYQEFSTTFLYSGDDATILVSQATDPNLTSLRSELSITDYTTITEFALDTTGTVEIDADDADGSSQKARLAIWYNGILTTENGARYLRGAITILSTAAFRINTSVLDLKIENVSATYGLNFTDTERRLYRDDGAAIYAPASAPGSIQNDYSGVPDTVETGVSGLTGSESAQLMALPNATSIAAAVWAYVISGSTTAVQMMRGFAAVLLGKVSGAGTGTETFRDIADTTDVVVATVDSDGNRTAITRTLT